jgi:hypothetical protein
LTEYIVRNRRTREVQRVKADNAQDACKACGWMIGDCFVQVVSPSTGVKG